MTLTDTAKYTKEVFIGLAIFLVVSFSLWAGYNYWYYNYYLPNKPEVIIPPENKFGPLPKINLSQGQSGQNLSFILNTENGSLPAKMPKLAKVYFVPQLGTTFLAPDRARDLAKKFNLISGPETIAPTKVRYSDEFRNQIIIDFDTNNFQLNRRLSPEATVSAYNKDEPIADQGKLIADFKSYLAQKNLLPKPLQNGRTKVEFDKPSQQESTMAAISLWPDDLDEHPFVSPTYISGLIKATVYKSAANDENYLNLDYTYWEADDKNASTYKILPVDKAFDSLKKGQAAVILKPSHTNDISLTEIFLAYYEPEEYTPYLQPVFVFKGDNFIAYLPALTPESYAK